MHVCCAAAFEIAAEIKTNKALGIGGALEIVLLQQSEANNEGVDPHAQSRGHEGAGPGAGSAWF